MKVEFKKVTNEKEFGELSNGAIFGFGGGFYIKMAYGIGEEGDFLNAVDLETGIPAFFIDDDEITEYPKAKTVIE